MTMTPGKLAAGVESDMSLFQEGMDAVGSDESQPVSDE